jgi:hypothetical protein
MPVGAFSFWSAAALLPLFFFRSAGILPAFLFSP